jgi:competence protein ComEA
MTHVRSALHLLVAAAALALASTTPVYPAAPIKAQRTPQLVPSTEPLDINTASLEQLMKIPGLPRTWAARIIRYRPYRAKNELLDRGIVSPEVYARIKDRIIAHRLRN